MDVICNHCNKSFHIRPSFYKKNKTKIFYCCKKCMLEHKHVEKIEVKCNTCGKKIIKRKTDIGNTNFCNMDCLKAYKPMKKLICKECNKEFEVSESYYNKQCKRGQEPKFCSVNCRVNNKRRDKYMMKCSICGKEIWSKNYIENKCCSKECRDKYLDLNNRVNTVCKFCGKQITINKYSFDNNNTHFCNINCFNSYRTIKRESYKEVSHYLRSSNEYNVWRLKCLKRDKYKCSKCDSKENLHVHHKTSLYEICENYDMNLDIIKTSNEFNDTNNGVTLCTDCHALEHPFVPRDEKGRFCRPHSKSQKNEEY